MILDPKKIKSVTASTFSFSICYEVLGPDAMILFLSFLTVEIQASFFTLPFHPPHDALWFLFTAIRVASSSYLRLLKFLPAILITALDSCSPAFHMMYSAYKLNKQDDIYIAISYSFPNFEPVHHSISRSNCCFLTCKQVSQETCMVIWSSHLFNNFPVYCDSCSQKL